MKAADTATLSVDLSSSFISSNAQDVTGEVTKVDSAFYSQKYRLFIEKDIYPLWRFRGGGLFQRDDSKIKEDGEKTDITSLRKNPFVDMIIGSTFLNASVGFNRREDVSKVNDQPTTKRFQDSYTSSLNYKPYDLPTLSLRLTRTNTYDGDRTDIDITRDQLLVNSRYRPVKPLEIIYSGQRNNSTNHLTFLETQSTIHTGRVSYGDQFINKRLSVDSTYSVGYREDELHASEPGEVETAPGGVVINYLSGLDDTPENDMGELTTTANFPAGIDIGSPDVPGFITPWNIGMEFSAESSLNLIRLFVNQDVSEVASSFVWDIYTSNGVDTGTGIEWTHQATVTNAPFDTFNNSFDIRFPPVQTRFIKVVVAPLSTSADPTKKFQNVLVTALTPLLVEPVPDEDQKTWRLTHLYNMSALARLLDNPALNYNFTFFYTETAPTSTSRFSMSNGLSLRRTIYDWLVGTARVSRDDSRQRPGDHEQVLYRYTGGLMANPLPTLSHNLTYSGQHETTDGETTVTNTVSLYNRAALYRGVDLLLGGNASYSSLPEEKKSQNYQTNYGLSIKPHRLLHMDLIGSLSRSTLTQPGEPDRVSTRQNNRLSVTYNPLPTLSFFLALEEVIKNDDRRTLQTYLVNWSPLSGGGLHFNLSYSENLRPEEDSFSKVWAATLRWRIRVATYLDLTYTHNDSHTSVQDSLVKALTISLKARF